MNLAALSQKYNMYFVAYLDTIHITKPRTLKQIIPGVPDLILRLPVSKHAGRGYLNLARPHSINNMIIGNLGNKEILLFCCDDGDVTAYYTDLLAEELQQAEQSTASSIPIGNTRPFFHENVGESAWGLAIHQKSRLIAVSSNKHEVTVFVHATYSNEPCNCAVMGTVLDLTYGEFVGHDNAQRAFPLMICNSKGLVFLDDDLFSESLFPVRHLIRTPIPDDPAAEGLLPEAPCSRNFRLILSPPSSYNIPAITFADDKNGLAEFILATDIGGNLWSLEIWRGTVKLFGSPVIDGHHLMGWAVMTIPLRYFRQSPNFQDALGMEDLNYAWQKSIHNRPGSEHCMNVSSCLERLELEDEANGGEPGTLFGGSELTSHTNGTQIINPGDNSDNEQEQYGEIVRSNSPPNKIKGLSCSKKDSPRPKRRLVLQPNDFMKQVDDISRSVVNPTPNLSDRAVILRTWKDSIELVPSFPSMPPTVCSSMYFSRGALTGFGQSFHQISRINMMALIPELSLVVVASQNGRAALLTLSTVGLISTPAPVPAFRIEALLPPEKFYQKYIKSHQAEKSPLLGMAVSPIQNGNGIKLEAGVYPRRWRLIMQSYDHTIWTYELSRDEDNNLRVF
ncbi:9cbdcb83-0be9-4bd8-9298-e053c3add996 [Sclerotinia trifoliorum]|uniref:9cbdcb83-0be9-4bd8-9298-e053c3add996 n=1 Tax=Sclerotinia trifoliorum TaxID=28548 RepID=A0A8H2ZPN2_9HELO|nr:9cbdcb83-0be9-4bd8-9298-e053c3add996 [Sclerotinia trifoliorum]